MHSGTLLSARNNGGRIRIRIVFTVIVYDGNEHNPGIFLTLSLNGLGWGLNISAKMI